MGDHVRENVKRNNHSYRHVIGNDTYRTAKSRRRHKRKLHTTNRHDMRSQLARLDQNHDIDSAMVPVKTHRSWRFPKRDELSYTILVTRYAHRVTYIKECDDEAGSLFMEPISRTSGRRGNRKVTKQVKRQLMELESKRDQIADEIETYNASVPIQDRKSVV